MAVRKVNGHAVTGVFPANSSDSTVVAPAKVMFQQAPTTQSGGKSGPKVVKSAR